MLRRSKIPTFPREYSESAANQIRRDIEIELITLSRDIAQAEVHKRARASKSLRRYQFLLMGAGNG